MRERDVARRVQLCLVAMMAIVTSVLTWLGARANAYQLMDDLEVRGTYKMESYFRLPDGTRDVFNAGTEKFHTRTSRSPDDSAQRVSTGHRVDTEPEEMG